MKKIIRIKDYYGVNTEIEISPDFDIRKGDEVYAQYLIFDVTQITHDIEEETVYYICKVKE